MGAEMTIEQLDEVIELEKENLNDFKLTFGAHKGKRLSEVPESYRVWLVKNLDGFNSLTASQKTTIAAQCMKLQGKAAEVAYDPRSIILFDLNNISYVLHKGNKLSMDGLMEYVSSWFPSCNTSNFKIVSDSKKSTYWRKKLYPDYKENRKPSADERFNKLLYELKLALQGQPFYVCQEILEADDIVATYARNTAYDRVTCISADSDFHQLTFYSRFVQISPLKKEVEVVSKREAIGTLVGKVLKGDPKDNIKKSHTQIKIKTEDLTIVKDRVYANLVDYVKRYPQIGAQDLPLRRIVWEELNVMFAMDRGMFDLNFTLINLIQREYSEVIDLLIS